MISVWSFAPILALISALWVYTVYISYSFPQLRGKRICLLIAHPDDEAMFFAPTLLAITRPELGNHVKILCLSTGNADGIGETRKKELMKSGLLLGLRDEKDILVLNKPLFPDSMTTTWHPGLISNHLTALFAPNMASIPSNQPPRCNIDALITFDSSGVSGHPNHKSLYKGAVKFLEAIMHRHPGWQRPVSVYTLTSVNILRKYASLMDAPLSIASAVWARKELGAAPTPLLFVSGPGNVRKAQQAMYQAHKSQMKWFRWGWIALSRYMVINDLKKYRIN